MVRAGRAGEVIGVVPSDGVKSSLCRIEGSFVALVEGVLGKSVDWASASARARARAKHSFSAERSLQLWR